MLIHAANRYQAFGIHIIISAFIFLILASIIVFVWYPGFLFKTDGGWQGIRLIAGVDFIIGPTLTLIVYKVGKAGLKFDLILIALIQFICLFAGTYLVFQERPIAIIFVNGGYETISKDFFDFHDIDIDVVLKMDDEVPVWLYLDLPQDDVKRREMLRFGTNYVPIIAKADLYRPYQSNVDKVFLESIDLMEMDESITKNMTNTSMLYYYEARYYNGYIEINKDTGDYIAIH